MPELWTTLTLPQTLLLLAAAYVLANLAGWAIDAVRRRLGKPIGDHCEHCELVEELGDRLDRLCDLVGDQAHTAEDTLVAIEAIRDAPEKSAIS